MDKRQDVDALLVVDVQRNLLEGSRAIPAAEDFVSRLGALLDCARAAGAPIFHMQNDGVTGSDEAPHTPGWEIHPRAAPTGNEMLFRKTVDDGFADTSLDEVLRSARIRRIAVAGLLSEMCVSATVRGAMARGYDVVLVQDCHATYDLGEIEHHVVSMVAEHALGDQVSIAPSANIAFGDRSSESRSLK